MKYSLARAICISSGATIVVAYALGVSAEALSFALLAQSIYWAGWPRGLK